MRKLHNETGKSRYEHSVQSVAWVSPSPLTWEGHLGLADRARVLALHPLQQHKQRKHAGINIHKPVNVCTGDKSPSQGSATSDDACANGVMGACNSWPANTLPERWAHSRLALDLQACHCTLFIMKMQCTKGVRHHPFAHLVDAGHVEVVAALSPDLGVLCMGKHTHTSGDGLVEGTGGHTYMHVADPSFKSESNEEAAVGTSSAVAVSCG